jgi:hypothetical protein
VIDPHLRRTLEYLFEKVRRVSLEMHCREVDAVLERPAPDSGDAVGDRRFRIRDFSG